MQFTHGQSLHLTVYKHFYSLVGLQRLWSFRWFLCLSLWQQRCSLVWLSNGDFSPSLFGSLHRAFSNALINRRVLQLLSEWLPYLSIVQDKKDPLFWRWACTVSVFDRPVFSMTTCAEHDTDWCSFVSVGFSLANFIRLDTATSMTRQFLVLSISCALLIFHLTTRPLAKLLFWVALIVWLVWTQIVSGSSLSSRVLELCR